jgi:hypothetical protein
MAKPQLLLPSLPTRMMVSGQWGGDLTGVVPPILDRGIDPDLVAGIDQSIGDVDGDTQRLTAADAGAGDAVDAGGFAGSAARPGDQMRVVLGLATRDTQRGMEAALRIHKIDRKIRAIAVIGAHLRGQRDAARLGWRREGQGREGECGREAKCGDDLVHPISPAGTAMPERWTSNLTLA